MIPRRLIALVLLVGALTAADPPGGTWIAITAPDSGQESLFAGWDTLNPLPPEAAKPADLLKAVRNAQTEWRTLSDKALDPDYRPGGSAYQRIAARFDGIAWVLDLTGEESAALEYARETGYGSTRLHFVELRGIDPQVANTRRAARSLALGDGFAPIPVMIAMPSGQPERDPITHDPLFPQQTHYSLIHGDADGKVYLRYLTCLRSLAQVIRTIDQDRVVNHDLPAIREANQRWENRLLYGYYQYPWELLANGYIIDSTWDKPSRFQIVALHPEAAVTFSPERKEGSLPKPALLVHAGVLIYLGSNFDGYVGLAATGSLAEDLGTGYGASMLMGHQQLRRRGIPSVSLGIQRFDDVGDDLFVTVGLDFFSSPVAKELFGK